MQEFPHHYLVHGLTRVGETGVVLSSKGLQSLNTDIPVDFGGPDDRWSPETLLVAAVADCFSLAFRIVARKFPWSELHCEVDGELDRVDRKTRFASFRIHAHLVISSDADPEQAVALLEKAEHVCVITNSLNGDVLLETDLERAPA